METDGINWTRYRVVWREGSKYWRESWHETKGGALTHVSFLITKGVTDRRIEKHVMTYIEEDGGSDGE